MQRFVLRTGEFKNYKMDEFVNKIGLKIEYTPAFSPWSNGINERNHPSCDITIEKLLEDIRTQLKDTIMKDTSWTHNTNV